MKTLILLLLLGFSSGAVAQTHFVAFLEASEEDPTFMVPGHGYGHFILSADSTELRYMLRIWKTSDTASAAHFHVGPRGMNADPVKFIPMAGGLSALGVWRRSDPTESFADTLIPHLFAGKIYVNAHTQNNPGGEIRGQIFMPKARVAIATKDQEVPTPVAGDTGRAVGVFVENQNDQLLYYRATAGGLSSPSRISHIHFGSWATPGPVIVRTTMDTTINTASGYWTSQVAPGFNDRREDYLRDSLYWNLHTVNNPGGELRGQILNPMQNGTSAIFTALLTAADEDIATAAEGTAVMLLSEDQRTLTIEAAASGLTTPLFLAHIHDGDLMQSGMPVVTLGTTPYGVSQTWTDLTPQDVAKLFNGEYYLNLHTTRYTNGEIRGQIIPLSQPVAQSSVVAQGSNRQLRLEPAFPNPATDHARLNYSLPASSTVSIQLLNALGQEVRAWEIGVRGAGDHEFEIDTRELPEGAYLIRLQAGEFVINSKILLAK